MGRAFFSSGWENGLRRDRPVCRMAVKRLIELLSSRLWGIKTNAEWQLYTLQSRKTKSVLRFCTLRSRKTKSVFGFCTLRNAKTELVCGVCILHSAKTKSVFGLCTLRSGHSKLVFYTLHTAERKISICFCILQCNES